MGNIFSRWAWRIFPAPCFDGVACGWGRPAFRFLCVRGGTSQGFRCGGPRQTSPSHGLARLPLKKFKFNDAQFKLSRFNLPPFDGYLTLRGCAWQKSRLATYRGGDANRIIRAERRRVRKNREDVGLSAAEAEGAITSEVDVEKRYYSAIQTDKIRCDSPLLYGARPGSPPRAHGSSKFGF